MESEESRMKVTLKWAGETGDGKRAFVVAEENDGWNDLRIEVDTDDCDQDHAKAAMQTVIDRCNAMAGIPSNRIVHAREELAALRKERDATLACLKLIESEGGNQFGMEDGAWCAEQAREVLASLQAKSP
jgi:hypothetical protein